MSLDSRHFRVSGSVFGNFHCSWIIPKFSELNFEVGKVIESEYFQFPENSSKWNLRVYPGGENDTCDGYVSCFVRPHSTNKIEDEFLNVFFYSFRDTAGKVKWEEKFQVNSWDVLKPGTGRGFNKTIEREALIKELIGNVLIISVNAAYCRTFIKDHKSTKYSTEMSPIGKLVEDYKSLTMQENNTDYVIVAEDEKIPVHSAILGARSKVFETMFESDMKEKKSKCVEITDFTKDIMESFIEFIYTGNINFMDIDSGLELLRASDKYQMDDLKLFCSNYLIAHLDDDNIGQILIRADMHNALKLKTESVDYFRACRDQETLKKHRPMLINYPLILYDILQANADDKD